MLSNRLAAIFFNSAAAGGQEVGDESVLKTASGRPPRQTVIAARDHLLAWRLQQSWSFKGEQL